MNDYHRPTPEFVSNLEWQIRTSHKRGNRFSEPVKPNPGGKMKIAVLVLASGLVGAGGVVVKDEVQEFRAQEVLLAQVESNLRMAELQLEMSRTQLEELQRLYDLGAVEEQALLDARTEVLQAEVAYSRLSLDQEEIRLSGKEPHNQLSASLVGGRDFVSERLILDETLARQQLSIVENRRERFQDLVQAGVVRSEDLAEVNLASQEAEAQLSGIQERIALRERFLEGELQPEEAENAFELSQTQTRLTLLRRALDGAIVRFQEAEKRVDLGLVHESELRRSRLEVMQLETQLEFLEIKLLALRGG